MQIDPKEKMKSRYHRINNPESIAHRITKLKMWELINKYLTYRDPCSIDDNDDTAIYSSWENRLSFFVFDCFYSVIPGKTSDDFQRRSRIRFRQLCDESTYIFYSTPEKIYIYERNDETLLAEGWKRIRNKKK